MNTNTDKKEVYSNPNMTAIELLDYSLANDVYVSLREVKAEQVVEKKKTKKKSERLSFSELGC